MGGIQGWHLVIIIVLALLLFGAPKLPGMARSMGQSLRIFKSEVRKMKDDDEDPKGETIDGHVVDPKTDEKND
ncbi:Sec-independent protein translocase subunit TatA [Glutamicibacter sp. MNS18]|uniref:Sec-independent protein translocase subunit TatA n=1 Tax=Glutamicibacter sp. MNS18 TaxID=2989817 RepID=UPI002235974B|nr:Sec-independent protein translocase subunit TatA [Glutamicibacter sp. MNS18]MCW4464889.1 Sec-independent protein translocase subunit TatA [Glutamicibacter sp. MNS18]